MANKCSSSTDGDQIKALPICRCANGMLFSVALLLIFSPIMGTHKTRDNFLLTQLLFQLIPTSPTNGATLTKVVSSGFPWIFMGNVFNSIPK